MTTRTYQQIQEEIAALQAEAQAVRASELAEARAQISAIMSQHGLNLDDLGRGASGGGGNGKGKEARKRAVRGPSVPKFKDPESGATWSGMGRTPNWAKGKNLEEMRISQGH